MTRLVVRFLVMAAVLHAGSVHAAMSPQQRGTVMGPPTQAARAVVTLCGLAVFMVEDSAGQSASLYAGAAIDERLAVDAIEFDAIEFDEYELAEMYTPVAAACESIRAEHERLLKDRAASDPVR